MGNVTTAANTQDIDLSSTLICRPLNENPCQECSENLLSLFCHLTRGQQRRILAALLVRRSRGVDTLYARNKLGIMAPASRINELRSIGFKIDTIRETLRDDSGGMCFGVARYVLIIEPGKACACGAIHNITEDKIRQCQLFA